MNQRNLHQHNAQGQSDFEFGFNDGKQDWRLLQIQPNTELIACVVHESHHPLSIKTFTRL